MNKFLLICASIILIGFAGTHFTRFIPNAHKDINYQDMYSGFPHATITSQPLQLKSSIIVDQEIVDSVNSTPCLMPMVVSEEFSVGYQDKMNGRKIKINKSQAYLDGYKLAEKDMIEGTNRLLKPQLSLD